MKSTYCGGISAAVLALMTSSSWAALVSAPLNSTYYADGGFQPATDSTKTSIIIGHSGTVNGFAAGSHFSDAVLVFQLPALGVGNVVGANTSLSVFLNTINTGGATSTIHADLWGVGGFTTSTTPTNYSSYTATGANETPTNPNPTATDAKITNDFLTGASVVGTIATTGDPAAASTTALQNYLTQFYTLNPTYDPATSTPVYVKFRINPDNISNSTTSRYSINGLPAAANIPTLAIEAVPAAGLPEPASLGLLSVGASALLRRRR